ncbi:hypothetical protein [Gracilimonas mengyeensis]|uniref:Secreted protein n=1 Tax=Gracilimonas mengyeensis TaxID=1302730 RepID=A0A521C173_9BACT|nr:hypothetical protein [Gracilimonas mengyeensis]SMO53134.1 hypothetical protein SAMN06265219_10471 [Gracilimonas mengyeensis]
MKYLYLLILCFIVITKPVLSQNGQSDSSSTTDTTGTEEINDSLKKIEQKLQNLTSVIEENQEDTTLAVGIIRIKKTMFHSK